MHVQIDSSRRIGEQRRYFPDWTHRSLARFAELEADHNSYLAGGYAEEFGYRAEPGCSRGVPTLDEELPERCLERRGQALATHPGYPLRAHPLARELFRTVRAWKVHARVVRAQAAEADVAQRHGAFVGVYNRSYGLKQNDARTRGTIVATRLAAAFVALRWKLR